MVSVPQIAAPNTLQRIRRVRVVTIVWMSVEAAVSPFVAWRADSLHSSHSVETAPSNFFHIRPFLQTFVVPALRREREGRGTLRVGDAIEIKG